MIRRLAVINYKGGTGKTCTVANLGHGLALRGYKVLVIDSDPQGSLTYLLGVRPTKTLYNLLIDDAPLSECIMNARPNLDIICANEHLFPAETKLARQKRREVVLSKKLAQVTGYDFIIMDCAPSMNIMNQNALLFASDIILPVSMEYLSLVGVKQLLKNIQIVNKIFKRSVRITRVVPTFYDKRNKKSKDVLESLSRVFPNYLSSPIRTSVGLSEAPGVRQTIFEYDPLSKGAEDYNQLVEEVLEDG